MELKEQQDLSTGKKEMDKLCRLRSLAAGGPKFPLLHEGDVMIFRLREKSLMGKLFGSKIPRRWETHRLVFSDTQIYSTTPNGYMEDALSYHDLQDVHAMPRWDIRQRFCVQIVLSHGSILLQANNAYLKEQWLHSLLWRSNTNKYQRLFANIKNPEDLLKELKDLIQLSLVTPLHDDIVFQLPLNTISNLLLHHGYRMTDPTIEALLKAAGPLLEIHNPTPSMCKCFQKICKKRSHKQEIVDAFVLSVQRILKHNTDFGKSPYLRTLVQDFLYVLYCRDETHEEIDNFIASVHTAGANCPHPRVLPNIVAVALAAFYSAYDDTTEFKGEERSQLLDCFQRLLKGIAQYPDWLPGLSALLQAVPFSKQALQDEKFCTVLADIIKIFAADKRCEVHQNVHSIREGRQGWIHHFAPDGCCCHDDAQAFSHIMSHLMSCCGKRKKTLLSVKNCMRNAFVLMAIRGDKSCIEALILMLDFELVGSEDEKQQIITALQTSENGRLQYEDLCNKKTKFREMRLQNGPKHLTLPTNSTDQDVAVVLKSGSFGNLETLNLAFTKVTSACAEHLIQLPSLLNLNLWGTHFDDGGLQLISEHVNTLQSLNLCETPVTDESILSLCLLPNLRFLNLNSTKLSAFVFEGLKGKLERLEEIDIRYTEAW